MPESAIEILSDYSLARVQQVKLTRPFSAQPPGSKSLTNRALIMAALCGEPIVLVNPLTSEDTEVAKEALRQLGVVIEELADGNWCVDGSAFAAQKVPPTLYLGNAGTAMRFLTAVLCARGIPCILDGTERMRERPIGDLLEALRDLGGDVRSVLENGCPPIEIGPGGLEGGETTVNGQVSSQFFSALMLAAPLARRDVTLYIKDELLSRPYVEMTARLLREFQVECEVAETRVYVSSAVSYAEAAASRIADMLIETDASAATYPLGLAYLHRVPASVKGLDGNSLQGDAKFIHWLGASRLGEFGAKFATDDLRLAIGDLPQRVFPSEAVREFDLREIPDAAMTLVTLLAVTPGKSTLTGLRNLAFKECDRLSALETELGSLGCKVAVREDRDGFEIEGVLPESLAATRPLRTYKDHRMAMCLAILGTVVPGGVEIEDPRCVEKTYPRFWDDLRDWIAQGTGTGAGAAGSAESSTT